MRVLASAVAILLQRFQVASEIFPPSIRSCIHFSSSSKAPSHKVCYALAHARLYHESRKELIPPSNDPPNRHPSSTKSLLSPRTIDLQNTLGCFPVSLTFNINVNQISRPSLRLFGKSVLNTTTVKHLSHRRL